MVFVLRVDLLAVWCGFCLWVGLLLLPGLAQGCRISRLLVARFL